MDTDRIILENKIFKYLLEDYKIYVSKSNYSTFNESFESWTNNIDNPIMRNYIVQDLFEKQFNISLHDLLAILKENKMTFKEYVSGIMTRYKLEEHLKEGLIEDLFKSDNNGSMSNDVEPNDVKKAIIKKSLDSEELDLDNLNDEELDKLMVNAVNINEKVDIIINHMRECDKQQTASIISKYTGMRIDEALSIL